MEQILFTKNDLNGKWCGGGQIWRQLTFIDTIQSIQIIPASLFMYTSNSSSSMPVKYLENTLPGAVGTMGVLDHSLTFKYAAGGFDTT